MNIEENNETTTTKKTAKELGSDNPDIEEPFYVCVETYIPKNCTNGLNHAPGEPCNPGFTSDAGWVVSVSCTWIPDKPMPPIGPGGPPDGCRTCAEPAPKNGFSGGGGYYFPPDSQNPNWTPKYICIRLGAKGECVKTIPYTPIITIPMADPYNYYANVFSREQIDKLLRIELLEARIAIDDFLERKKTAQGTYSQEDRVLVYNVLDAVLSNPADDVTDGSRIDAKASLRSPFNIDRTSIPFDITKPENQKFNEIYESLTTSPEFQKLFINLFKDSDRFNVKFEVEEHVYEDDNPANKEVNAITIQDQVTRNIVIKMNKQILSPDGTMKQTKIENAKTILHECIHAYLFVKAENSNVGVDFV